MIPLDDFKTLPFDKKCDFITVFADYLIYRTEDENKFYLYYLAGYFVEVCYAPFENKVLGINAFDSATGLGPYLDAIQIGELAV
ncbi:hypothetical protein [Fulvivirga sediminis]|uniref:Uncharacterized protein n=1 Tax=Fulvivirga sediminis TaxID=2803949 RepID=A0A937F5X4_9BACT|nr:hypothetical protein [Fulvivirga sediminis]MBL3654603.1 hypothetical protein [Fulvivirga sediminis]